MPKKSAKSLSEGGTPFRKPVALTVKIDDDTYVRLARLRASQRRTHQDILKQALEEYLDREGA
jgi:predicted transcriptional regulator